MTKTDTTFPYVCKYYNASCPLLDQDEEFKEYPVAFYTKKAGDCYFVHFKLLEKIKFLVYKSSNSSRMHHIITQDLCKHGRTHSSYIPRFNRCLRHGDSVLQVRPDSDTSVLSKWQVEVQ